MQVRTQLAIVAVIAAGWSAGNAAMVEPVVAGVSPAERRSLAALESAFAANKSDVRTLRALTGRYLEQRLWQFVSDTIAQAPAAVQNDPRIVLHLAMAEENLASLHSASARIDGALNRCASMAEELAAGSGCDVRTQTELALESAALERMLAWGIDPVRDPERASLAHQLAARPVTLGRAR